MKQRCLCFSPGVQEEQDENSARLNLLAMPEIGAYVACYWYEFVLMLLTTGTFVEIELNSSLWSCVIMFDES